MRTRSFEVKVSGPLAVFTRPELKAERVSYEVMTPSAARGVLEAVFWKPAVAWVVERIAVLKPIAWTSFRRNEVNAKASPRMTNYCADEDRAQRNTVALKDVAYCITAHMSLTPRAEPDENALKFEEMFSRRLEKGQCFHQPYLGCREMAAHVEPAPAGVTPIEPGVVRPLGLMFFDFDYDAAPTRPLFFDARLESGVLQVPARADVMRQNGGAQ